MEVAAAAYGAETVVEGGIAAYFLAKSTLPLKARLEHIATTGSLPRSSHTLAVISDRAYIFGGEDSGNEVASNDLHELHIPTDETTTAVLRTISAAEQGTEAVPSSRIGHSAAVARDRMFLFGGRASEKSEVLSEHGRIWVMDPVDSRWTFLDPPPNTTYPSPRCFHASTSSPDGKTIFIHGGMSPDGSYLADVWGFYLDEGKWERLPDAPTPPRTNTSLACGQGKLWRFGGRSNGETLGGALDFLELPKNGTIEDPVESAKLDRWQTWSFGESSKMPSPRSSGALHFITTGNGRDYLLLALGEGEKSKESTQENLLADLWAYQLPAPTFSGAGVKDAIRGALPKVETHDGEWSQLEITNIKVGEDEKKDGTWTGRSQFGTAMTGSKQFMIWGGVNPRDETLGDGWRVIVE
ncbi:kelch domain-containing protein [Rutstroemia sp. NJR-2017a WRK4]|nr:kelch domain-containing protein [Rutstroemia sp. NJR-2017a WRK4]PQE11710.1 kelch domain-containing protein [Rutstroemia sp. NJR-2017a WRK4]